MNRMNRIFKLKYYFCLAVILLPVSSCIQTELSETCLPETGLRILFSYDRTEEMDVEDQAGLKNAVIFVYDQSGRFIAYREINDPRFNETYQVDMELKAGTYRFVAWFNSCSPYVFNPVLDDLVAGQAGNKQQFLLQIPDNGIIDENETVLPLMLYGNKEAIVNGTGNPVTIPVTRNTNTVNISVEGLLPDDHDYRFGITDDNGIYTFDNDLSLCTRFSYIKDAKYESGALGSSLTVLKLSGNRPGASLKILDATTREVLFPNAKGITTNLVRLLELVYPGNDFSKKHNYNLDILFSGTDVRINGWRLVPSDNELITE
jgi:hypothetical protein